MKIMAVEDDPGTRLLYEVELKAAGYDVITAANGAEALEMFRASAPDLVILDVQMPGMDGIEVLCRMLSIDRTVPIVFVSAHEYFKQNYLSWAADAYITKSADFTELKKTMKKLLRRNKANAPKSNYAQVGPS